MARTEVVSNLIWAPDFFGPREIWAPRSLVPEEYGPQEIWSPHENHHMAFFMQGPNFLGSKFLGDQISWGPKKSGAQMRTGTISVVAL